MTFREFFSEGGYFWATVIAVAQDENDPRMLAVETDNTPFVARPCMGHMKSCNDDPNKITWKFIRPVDQKEPNQ